MGEGYEPSYKLDLCPLDEYDGVPIHVDKRRDPRPRVLEDCRVCYGEGEVRGKPDPDLESINILVSKTIKIARHMGILLKEHEEDL